MLWSWKDWIRRFDSNSNLNARFEIRFERKWPIRRSLATTATTDSSATYYCYVLLLVCQVPSARGVTTLDQLQFTNWYLGDGLYNGRVVSTSAPVPRHEWNRPALQGHMCPWHSLTGWSASCHCWQLTFSPANKYCSVFTVRRYA